MRLLAPAKINLHLRVGPLSRGGSGLAPGGFHPLLTWMVTIGLFDTLTLDETAPTAAAVGVPPARLAGDAAHTAGEAAGGVIALRCDDRSLPTDANNLIVRVGQALADTLGRVGEGPTGGRE